MARWAVMSLALASCDFALGLEQIEQSHVEGSILHRYTVNDATYAPQVVERVVPRDQLPISVTLEDGTRPVVDYRDDGTFSFARDAPDQSYRLVFATDTLRAEIVSSTATLRTGFLTGGRLDRRPIGPHKIELMFPIQSAAGSSATITSTGVYTNTTTGVYGPDVSWDFRLANPAPGSVTGLLDASENDRIYALELESIVGYGSPTFSRIRALTAASVTMVAGGTTRLDTPAPVTPNSCVHVIAPNASETTRMINAVTRDYTSTASNWIVYSAPAPGQLGFSGELYPAICGITGTPDLDISPEYHDPYPGTTPLIESAVAAYYPVELPGSMPNNYATVIRRYDLAERGQPGACNPTPTVLTASVGIPGEHAVDGQRLESDNQLVSIDLGRPVELSWSVVDPGPVDFFSVTLQELVDVGGVTSGVARWSATVQGQTQVTIEPELVEPGHTYIVGVVAWTGRPGASIGDFLTFQYPMAISTVWSRTFTVEAR